MPELAKEIDKVVTNPDLEAIEGRNEDNVNGQVKGENTETEGVNGRS